MPTQSYAELPLRDGDESRELGMEEGEAEPRQYQPGTRSRYLFLSLAAFALLALGGATLGAVRGQLAKSSMKDIQQKHSKAQSVDISSQKVYLVQNVKCGTFMHAGPDGITLAAIPTEASLWAFIPSTSVANTANCQDCSGVPGQDYIANWSPTMGEYSSDPIQVLNIYGGDTSNGGTVGLYEMDSDSNSLWRVSNIVADEPDVFTFENYNTEGEYANCGSCGGCSLRSWDNPADTLTQWRLIGGTPEHLLKLKMAASLFMNKFECGQIGNNWGTDNGPTAGDDSCDCMTQCIKGEGDAAGCVVWTWMNSTAEGGLPNNAGSCYFGTTLSGAGMIDNCAAPSVCISAELVWNAEYLKGHHKQIAKAAVAALPTTTTQTTTPSYCSTVQQKEGNITYIASPSFKKEEPWPATNDAAYKLLSQCLTSAACDPDQFSKAPPPNATDVRVTYANVAGTAKLAVYEDRVGNSAMMAQLRKSAGKSISESDWSKTVLQISTEIYMLKAVAGSFAVYSSFMVDIQGQLREAFTSMLTILLLPADTAVAKPKIHWASIVCQALLVIGSSILVVASDGSAAVFIGAAMVAVSAAGTSAAAGVAAWPRSAPTLAPAAADDSATVMEFSDVMDMMVWFLDTFLVEIGQQLKTVASNWGRLQAGNALSSACPMDENSLKVLAVHAYGAMQWYALGLLMPSKYAIYWQRDYGGLKGPSCYYNGKTSSTDGCEASATGCWTLGATEIDFSSYYSCSEAGNDKQDSDESTINSCYENNVPSNHNNQQCDAAQRNIWIGEIGSPSSVPSSDFFSSLADKYEGPITTYVNTRFGTNYMGAKGAFSAFMSQCQYMPKLYIPPTSGGKISHSATSPSTVAVTCDVYGIDIPVYAFADCNTNQAATGAGDELTGTCINGYGQSFGAIDSGVNNKYMWSSGNFNQAMYIPNVKKRFATQDDGKVACCMPWLSTLPSECDYAVCDCFSVQQAINNNWMSSTASGLWRTASDCDVDTGDPSSTQMMITSLGASWNWTAVIESEGKIEGMAT